MISTDPHFKCLQYFLYASHQKIARYCTRADAERAIKRLAPAYKIPIAEFVIKEEYV